SFVIPRPPRRARDLLFSSPLLFVRCGTVTPDCALGSSFLTPPKPGPEGAPPFAFLSEGWALTTGHLARSSLHPLCAFCVLPSVTGACPDPVGVLLSLFSANLSALCASALSFLFSFLPLLCFLHVLCLFYLTNLGSLISDR